VWCWQFTVVIARTHISFVGRSVRWRTLIWWIWLAPWVMGIVVVVASSLSRVQAFRSGFSRGVRCLQTGSNWND
jgi:hypothetical protein